MTEKYFLFCQNIACCHHTEKIELWLQMLENLFVQSTNLKHSEYPVHSYQDMTSSEKREDKTTILYAS